jgi:hypothetical protein
MLGKTGRALEWRNFEVYKAIEWAKTMTWKGIKPIVHYCQKIYENGIKLTEKEMEPYENSSISLFTQMGYYY